MWEYSLLKLNLARIWHTVSNLNSELQQEA